MANDPVNQSDPLGLYGPTGAASSAAASAILQIGSNLIQTGVDIGRSLRCVNVNNVVVSGVLGAVGPTLGQQVLRGIPGPGEISRIAETLIYIETVVPLGVLTKMALPDLTIGNLLRALSLPVALSGRKSECEGLSLGNAISTIVQ